MTPLHALTPKTEDGIKRLASRLKQENACSQSEGLDLAAVQAGFTNYRHALNALRTAGDQPEAVTYDVIIRERYEDEKGKIQTLEHVFKSPIPAVELRKNCHDYTLAEFTRHKDGSLTRKKLLEGASPDQGVPGITLRYLSIMAYGEFRRASSMERWAFDNELYRKLPRFGYPDHDHTLIVVHAPSGKAVMFNQPYDSGLNAQKTELYARNGLQRVTAPGSIGFHQGMASSFQIIASDDAPDFYPVMWNIITAQHRMRGRTGDPLGTWRDRLRTLDPIQYGKYFPA